MIIWAILCTVLCLLCVGLAFAATAGDSVVLTGLFGFCYVILGNAALILWAIVVIRYLIDYAASSGL